MNASPLFPRVAIIGLGLIGSSIARGTLALGLAGEIVATDGSADVRQRARELGLAHRIAETNAEAVKDADLVIACVPVGACGAVAQDIAASSQGRRDRLRRRLGQDRRAEGHGRAPAGDGRLHSGASGGRHRTLGPDAGFAELFVNRWCILTPSETASPDGVERLKAFWQALGANVETMTAEHHDLVLAITSHLPHLIAYTIVGTADELEGVTESEVLKFSAGGFRDFTRIAASDPTMWRDVFLNNKDAVLEMLGEFQEDLSKLTRAIRRGDGDALFEHFSRTRAIRRGILNIGQDAASADFGRPHQGLPPKGDGKS